MKKKDNTPTPEPTPVTKTVLAGMDASGITLYGDVEDGRLATCQDNDGVSYTFHWGMMK